MKFAIGTTAALVMVAGTALGQSSTSSGQSGSDSMTRQPTDRTTQQNRPQDADRQRQETDRQGMGQQQGGASWDDPAHREARRRDATPGPQHQWLRQFEGSWDVQATEHRGGQGSGESKRGQMNSRVEFDGLFLTMFTTGNDDGKFFHGLGHLGFNNTDQRFEYVWLSSMKSEIAMMRGSLDQDRRVLTLTGTHNDPVYGANTPVLIVATMADPNTWRWEFFSGGGAAGGTGTRSGTGASGTTGSGLGTSPSGTGTDRSPSATTPGSTSSGTGTSGTGTTGTSGTGTSGTGTSGTGTSGTGTTGTGTTGTDRTGTGTGASGSTGTGQTASSGMTGTGTSGTGTTGASATGTGLAAGRADMNKVMELVMTRSGAGPRTSGQDPRGGGGQ